MSGIRFVCVVLLCTGGLAICIACSESKVALDAKFEKQRQSLLDEGVRKHEIRGVSAAIVFPDGTVWTGVGGVSHDTVPMKPDMLFGIGSVTKNFVAALTLLLAEEGALSLDDPISDYLPAYPHVDGDITIRQLLNHTSGLYMFWDNDDLWEALKEDRSKVWTPEEVLAYIEEPYFEPGEGWRYSNTNYLLLAMIIEETTGNKLSTEFRNRFWVPLGIDAYLAIQETVPKNRAHVFGDNFQFGEQEMDLTFEPRASHDSIGFGSSGICMTAEELARWCQALYTGKILNKESMDEMLQFVKFRPVSATRLQYESLWLGRAEIPTRFFQLAGSHRAWRW